MLSPGLRYVLSLILPKLAGPPALLLAIATAAEHLGHGDDDYIRRIKSAPVLLGSIFVVAFLRSQWTRWSQYREMKRLGAVPVPVVKGKWPGNLDVLLGLLKSFREDYATQFLEEKAAQYGYIYKLEMLGDEMVVTLNPKDIKRIMATDFQNWDKGEKFKGPMRSVLGTGVFNSDGDMWKFHRTMTRPFFSRERISDFEIFSRHSDHAVDLIRQRCATGQPIDLQDLAGRFTMDSASEFLFGRSVKSMSSPLPMPRSSAHDTVDSENAFVKAFSTVLEASAKRLYIGKQWPLWEMFGDRTKGGMKVIKDYLDPLVDDAMRNKAQVQSKGEKEFKTLLDHLVAATDDRTVVRDELLNILLAGRDTTAHGITAIFYFLATQDKRIIQKLREEILAVVGPHEKMPTFEQIHKMKYLRAVIHETLRLMPSVPANLRTAVNSTVWDSEDGSKKYYIPQGSTATWSSIGLHRRRDLWGPDACAFDPDRWLDERNKKYFLANPFIFIPFHGGPRICLGQQFALNEASFFVVRMLQAFDSIDFAVDGFPQGTLAPAEWKTGGGKGRKTMEYVHPKVHLTMYFKGGLWLRMGGAKLAEVQA